VTRIGGRWSFFGWSAVVVEAEAWTVVDAVLLVVVVTGRFPADGGLQGLLDL
jgi:hypothetical protein